MENIHKYRIEEHPIIMLTNKQFGNIYILENIFTLKILQ